MQIWILATAIASLALSGCEPDGTALRASAVEAVSRERAAAVYAQHCAICHGEKGDGLGPRRSSLYRKPPDFRSVTWREGRTSRQVRTVIRDGIPGSDMPSWRRLDAAEIAGLADYILDLGSAAGGEDPER